MEDEKRTAQRIIYDHNIDFGSKGLASPLLQDFVRVRRAGLRVAVAQCLLSFGYILARHGLVRRSLFAHVVVKVMQQVMWAGT